MTTEQLIEELRKHPGRRVVVSGHHGGWGDPSNLETIALRIDANKDSDSDYYGDHEEVITHLTDGTPTGEGFDEMAVRLG